MREQKNIFLNFYFVSVICGRYRQLIHVRRIRNVGILRFVALRGMAETFIIF